MIKVFLVEDEFVVREGIKKNIDWLSHGYEFCGEAADGELALPLIRKLQPDIVITDIKMPFMDGLALSKVIKREFPWIEIIILSGYEEFEYAKEGIKIGVAQYLTKPIGGAEILKEVDALSEKIAENRRERELKEKYRMEMKENSQRERKELFQDLVTGRKSVPELLEQSLKLHMDIASLYYGIVLMMTQSLKHAQNEYSGSLIRIEQRLEEYAEDAGIAVFDRNLEGKALLFTADSEEELRSRQDAFFAAMQEVLKEYENIRYFCAVGTAVNRLTELPTSFEVACHAYAHRYLMSGSHILYADENKNVSSEVAWMAPVYRLENDTFDIKNVDPKQIDRERIEEFLKFGDAGETGYFVEEFFKGLGTNALESDLFRKYIAMDAYFCVAKFVESMSFQRDEIESFDISAKSLQDRQATMEYLVRIISKALEMRENAASNRYGDVVEEVKNYIAGHYGEEELTLNVLASLVNFSPSHLSLIFSQETGQTFIKYLTDYRMNKAKELLRCSGKRSSAICMEVGYRDPHYFSYLFKKTQGMTPTQYRGPKTAEGEE